MAKPVGSACNLNCDYCYYRGREPAVMMDDETLERYIDEYISLQPLSDVFFIWQGGEPTLAGLDFYRRVGEFQLIHARGKRISNCLQTNGILIDGEWARWLSENEWLVGLSIDGSRRVHDVYRRDNRGTGTWEQVIKAAQNLERHGVEWNAMVTVSSANVHSPGEVYDCVTGLGARFIQFSPVVEWEGEKLLPWSVTPESWGKFLCDVYQRWSERDIGKVSVGVFEAAFASAQGFEAGVCTHCRQCGTAAVITANGDVYPCDHYVWPRFKLGNINEHTLASMLLDGRLKRFGSMKHESLPVDCLNCRFLTICSGECPKNRLHSGRNYLCRGYSMLYEKMFGSSV